MKKIILTMVLAVAATNINAQLVVDSIGRVGIGTSTNRNLLNRLAEYRKSQNKSINGSSLFRRFRTLCK